MAKLQLYKYSKNKYVSCLSYRNRKTIKPDLVLENLSKGDFIWLVLFCHIKSQINSKICLLLCVYLNSMFIPAKE